MQGWYQFIEVRKITTFQNNNRFLDILNIKEEREDPSNLLLFYSPSYFSLSISLYYLFIVQNFELVNKQFNRISQEN